MGTCRGRGVSNNNGFTLLRDHSHPPITTKLKQEEFKRDLCRAVVNNLNDKFKKIYESVRIK